MIMLKGLEIAINNYLCLDPDTLHRLAQIKGKIIQMQLSDWGINFFVLPHEDGIELQSQTKMTPDVIIKGNPFAFLRMLQTKKKGTSIVSNEIDTMGDAELAQTFYEIIQQIDIDWEEHLARIAGDTPAHKIFFYSKKILGAGEHLLQTFRDNVKEYIQHEKKIVPAPEQCEQFYNDIAELRDDVDRLEARIKRVASAFSKKKNI
jgi:ubiquinone biosynthesis accessory factor UbiJ